MRKTIAATLAATAITFGGVGVAHATAPEAASSASVVAQQAQDEHSDSEGSDKTGLWGLLGLSGLLGLAGLKRRNDPTVRTGVGTDATRRP